MSHKVRFSLSPRKKRTGLKLGIQVNIAINTKSPCKNKQPIVRKCLKNSNVIAQQNGKSNLGEHTHNKSSKKKIPQ